MLGLEDQSHRPAAAELEQLVLAQVKPRAAAEKLGRLPRSEQFMADEFLGGRAVGIPWQSRFASTRWAVERSRLFFNSRKNSALERLIAEAAGGTLGA